MMSSLPFWVTGKADVQISRPTQLVRSHAFVVSENLKRVSEHQSGGYSPPLD